MTTIINKNNPEFKTASKEEVGGFIWKHIQKHFPRQHRFYHKFLRGLSHKDIKQDLFLYLWEKIDSYDPKKSSFNTWFHWGLLHVMKKHNDQIFKQRNIKKNYKQSKPPISYLEDFSKTDDSDQVKIIDTNDIDQQILILKYKKNKTIQSISNKLNIPEETIETVCRKYSELFENVL